MEGMTVPEMLTILVRRTVRSGWRLLLLVDEAEELLTISRTDPVILARMRRVLQKGPELRSVLTSTKRLAQIDQLMQVATSPFLQGFIPPLYLTPLQDAEARALLERGSFSADENRTIMERTGNHPFLVQLMASRLFENRNLSAILDQLAADEMVANFFSVDFQTLDGGERTVLGEVAKHPGATQADLVLSTRLETEALDGILYGLRMLGYISAYQGTHRLSNWFFERWLRRALLSPPAEEQARTIPEAR
jgi:hypothetical protein